MENAIKLWVQVMVFEPNSVPKRIMIPVDETRIGSYEDWDARVKVMNSDTVKMWQTGSLSGKEYEERAAAQESKLLSKD